MKLVVATPNTSSSYDIEIGSGILDQVPSYVKSLASRFAIVTHERLAPLCGERLKGSLLSAGLIVDLFTFPSGEQFKTRETKEQLENQLLGHGYGRDSCVIALGGGIVTDLVGYLAATYCRGVPLVMIPTSLLGMVDASIGGKTGVNVPQGKNMVGCIYRPSKTIIDPLLLKSLPKKEISSGVVEMIKHGIIADHSLFEYLEKHVKQVLALDPAVLEKVIYESVRIKKEIVELDEKDLGKRRLLNFGHTVGHVLEKLTHYEISHGEGVAIGILVESHLAMQLKLLDQRSFDRIYRLFIQYELPCKLPLKLPIQTVIDAMSMDKKSLKGIARFVIIDGIGFSQEYGGAYCTSVDETVLYRAIQWMHDALC